MAQGDAGRAGTRTGGAESAGVAARALRKRALAEWDRLSAADRDWFAARPERSYRLRPIANVERFILRATPATHVLVRQVRTGFRLRRPVIIAGATPDADPVLERFDRDGIVHVGPGGAA